MSGIPTFLCSASVYLSLEATVCTRKPWTSASRGWPLASGCTSSPREKWTCSRKTWGSYWRYFRNSSFGTEGDQKSRCQIEIWQRLITLGPAESSCRRSLWLISSVVYFPKKISRVVKIHNVVHEREESSSSVRVYTNPQSANQGHSCLTLLTCSVRYLKN